MENRILIATDSKQVASLHYIAFKNFFLTSLGQTFLNYFYRGVLRDKEGIGIGIFENEQLLGFVIGTTDIGGFYKKIAFNNFVPLVCSSIFSVIKNPTIIFRLLKGLESSGKQITGTVLLSICVDPNCEKLGLGSRLIKAFETQLSLEISSYSLTTDYLDNKKANDFYIKNGLEIVGQIQQDKRILNIYTKIIKR